MKKVLTLCMALILVLTAAVTMLASCGGGNTPSDDTNKPVGGGNTDSSERIPLDVPEKYYEVDGEKTQYHILEWAAGGQNTPGQSWIPWEEGDVETEDGDMLGSAVFRRNAWVEQEFGVEITKEYASVEIAPTFKTRVTNNASTSANEFQLITLRTLNIIELIQEDLYLDMNLYSDILHTNQPWWVKDAVTSFTLGSHLYVASTELLLRDKGATSTLYFNQYMARDYEDDLPNFFELVDNKEWTIERMIDACEIVAHPNDGDDELNSTDDVWGIVGGDDPVYYLYNAFGYKFAHIDEFGYIEYDYGFNPETITVMQDIFLNVMYADFYFNNYVMSDLLEEGQNVFVQGNSLFYSSMVKDTTTRMKNMEDLYGILPHPMLDEDQEDYSSLVWVHHDASLGIPAHVSDPEMCAIILEALSWESYYTVFPVFYETILLNRAAKDEDSKRMLEVVFGARSYDPGQYYDSGSNASGLHGNDGLLRLTTKGTYDIAGMWAGFRGVVEANMQEVNNWIAGNED